MKLADLEANDLVEGAAPIKAALLQGSGGTSKDGRQSPNAAMILVIEVDGKKVVAKTTLRLMEMTVQAMRTRHGPHIDTDSTLPSDDPGAGKTH